MIKRLNAFNITEKDQLQLDLANWAVGSHYWVEYHPGYFQCEWCKEYLTSTMVINVDSPLCKKNPSLENFIEAHIGDYIDPENELC